MAEKAAGICESQVASWATEVGSSSSGISSIVVWGTGSLYTRSSLSFSGASSTRVCATASRATLRFMVASATFERTLGASESSSLWVMVMGVSMVRL